MDICSMCLLTCLWFNINELRRQLSRLNLWCALMWLARPAPEETSTLNIPPVMRGWLQSGRVIHLAGVALVFFLSESCLIAVNTASCGLSPSVSVSSKSLEVALMCIKKLNTVHDGCCLYEKPIIKFIIWSNIWRA